MTEQTKEDLATLTKYDCRTKLKIGAAKSQLKLALDCQLIHVGSLGKQRLLDACKYINADCNS